ncbi:hypothetical protein CITRIK5_60107 [Citricoccus sp. K5]|nr:hypothetical protein CITRIK5_60107 [Citricoccus sp. K5]
MNMPETQLITGPPDPDGDCVLIWSRAAESEPHGHDSTHAQALEQLIQYDRSAPQALIQLNVNTGSRIDAIS